MHNRVASETDIYGRRKFRKDDSPVPTTKSCEIKVIKSEDENQDNEEIWAKQKKQFTSQAIIGGYTSQHSCQKWSRD